MSTNSLDLEAKLIENVVEKRNALISEAKKKASEIIDSANQEVETIKLDSEKQILSLVGSELKAANDRIIGKAELGGRKLLMQTRQELLTKVFEEVENRLEEMVASRSPEYTATLEGMISESVSAIGGDEFYVAANERDLAYLKKNIQKINKKLKQDLGEGSINLEENPLDIMGGVVVRNSDSTKIYYNTLRGKLENVRSKLEAEVAVILGVI